MLVVFIHPSVHHSCGFILSWFPAEKKKPSVLDSLDNVNITIIGLTCSVVVILLVVSGIIQIKQPRKKYIVRRDDFDPNLFHEAFEPPHYELCTLRRDNSTEMDEMAQDFQKLRRSSSKCIRDHHCGSQASSAHGSRTDLSLREAAAALGDPQAILPHLPLHHPMHHPATATVTTPSGRRSILVMKHSYSHDGAEDCDPEADELDEGPSHGRARLERAVHRSVSNDF